MWIFFVVVFLASFEARWAALFSNYLETHVCSDFFGNVSDKYAISVVSDDYRIIGVVLSFFFWGDVNISVLSNIHHKYHLYYYGNLPKDRIKQNTLNHCILHVV